MRAISYRASEITAERGTHLLGLEDLDSTELCAYGDADVEDIGADGPAEGGGANAELGPAGKADRGRARLTI